LSLVNRNQLKAATFLIAASMILHAQNTSSWPSAGIVQPTPITSTQRWHWFIGSTIGPQSLAGGVFSAGFGTALNMPREYHGTWQGFGQRYGMRLTGISTGNAMEAGLGAVWGEDPRYSRVPNHPFRSRIENAAKLTFLAYQYDARLKPAYARFIGIVGNNILSNAWRPDSEADWHHAVFRSALGLAGRMGSNTFQEFWPDIRARLFHRRHGRSSPFRTASN
jgi:hypothetical protein